MQLDEGHDHRAAAERLDITPGETYLIATGWPADGTDDRLTSEMR